MLVSGCPSIKTWPETGTVNIDMSKDPIGNGNDECLAASLTATSLEVWRVPPVLAVEVAGEEETENALADKAEEFRTAMEEMPVSRRSRTAGPVVFIS